jgi:hypothetical protein
MKRAAFGFLLLFLIAGVPLLAAQTKLVDDVIRMSKAGVSDDAIVAFIQGFPDRPLATADDVIAMSAAGVSPAVIRAMIGATPAGPEQANREPPDGNPPSDADKARGAPPQPAEPEVEDGPGCLVFDPPIAVIRGPFLPPWLWDPHWYQPRLDIKGGGVPTMGAAGRPPLATAREQASAAQGAGARPRRETRQPESPDPSQRGAARRR